jgi:hypothetical protein
VVPYDNKYSMRHENMLASHSTHLHFDADDFRDMACLALRNSNDYRDSIDKVVVLRKIQRSCYVAFLARYTSFTAGLCNARQSMKHHPTCYKAMRIDGAVYGDRIEMGDDWRTSRAHALWRL